MDKAGEKEKFVNGNEREKVYLNKKNMDDLKFQSVFWLLEK